MKYPHEIVKYPVISEKGTEMQEKYDKYFFRVDLRANKIEIQQAIEELFNVKVKKINTMNVRGKKKRLGRYAGVTSAWKKAIVTLEPGQKIEFV